MVSTHTIFSVLLLSGSALAGNSRQINPKNARLTAREVAILNALDQRSDYWLDLAPRSSSPDGPPAPTVKRRSSKGSTGSPPAVSASSSGDESVSEPKASPTPNSRRRYRAPVSHPALGRRVQHRLQIGLHGRTKPRMPGTSRPRLQKERTSS